MNRDLNYDDRTAIYQALADLRAAEHALILGIRATYAHIAIGSIHAARADIQAALTALDAAEALINPDPLADAMITRGPQAPAPSETPIRLVPRFETAPPPTTGDAA